MLKGVKNSGILKSAPGLSLKKLIVESLGVLLFSGE